MKSMHFPKLRHCPTQNPDTEASFTTDQVNQIRDIVNSSLSLRGTASPINDFVTQEIHTQTDAGINSLRNQYKTLSPAACVQAMKDYDNNDDPPLWAKNITKNTSQQLEDSLQQKMRDIYSSCKDTSDTNVPKICSEASINDVNTLFTCSDDTCTIDMGDKILYITGDVMVDNTLTVQQDLVADTVHGLVLTTNDSCNYSCSPPPALA